MTQEHRTAVTVVGLGLMGAALARAFVDAGYATTVWNRSPEKGAALVEAGAVQARTIDEAVTASPLVVSCLSTYDATFAALEPAGSVLRGRTLVTVNSGTPVGARAMAAWAKDRGARFLDGAVKNVPGAVGLPDTLLYYSGDREVFDEHVRTLRALGGDTVHLGEDPDLSALYEAAVGGMLLPALLGFFEGAYMVRERGLEAESLVRYSAKWLEMIIAILPGFAQEIDSGDYSRPISTVGTFHETIEHDREIAENSGVDNSWHAPMHELLERAVARGRRDQSVAALYELMGEPLPAR
ncbi:NAD(P)-dependent oxidoreductase [Nocardiopsis sp. NPDC006938]|uniref:NAD(P)-dependent oxidoreductase n=1 Tax=Nocardiopsis sp. NPDC006938 TaxID=3364337 RepID=UPI003674451E